jgi:hypothetical protein
MGERGIPLHVIGVGTLAGGQLPVVRTATGELLDSPGTSRLERASLQRIAAAGHGRYFELDRDDDRHIANSIVAEGRRLAPAIGMRETTADLYWWPIAGALILPALALVAVSRPVELAMLLVGSVTTAFALSQWLW